MKLGITPMAGQRITLLSAVDQPGFSVGLLACAAHIGSECLEADSGIADRRHAETDGARAIVPVSVCVSE